MDVQHREFPTHTLQCKDAQPVALRVTTVNYNTLFSTASKLSPWSGAEPDSGVCRSIQVADSYAQGNMVVTR